MTSNWDPNKHPRDKNGEFSVTVEQKAAAKLGTHHVSFQPGFPAKELKVLGFSGGKAKVQLMSEAGTGKHFNLNKVATAKLASGGYRKK